MNQGDGDGEEKELVLVQIKSSADIHKSHGSIALHIKRPATHVTALSIHNGDVERVLLPTEVGGVAVALIHAADVGGLGVAGQDVGFGHAESPHFRGV